MNVLRTGGRAGSAGVITEPGYACFQNLWLTLKHLRRIQGNHSHKLISDSQSLNHSWADMRPEPRILVFFAIALTATCCIGSESAFFREFVASVSTNDDLHAVAIRSPSLVDTNNAAPKLASGTTNSINEMLERGIVSGVSLSMTMSEVVSRWGKPYRFYARCGGGPRFLYTDVSLVFHGDILWEVGIPGDHRIDPWYPKPRSTQFGHGLTGGSASQDYIRVLGEPTRQTSWREVLDYLVYESGEQVLILAFYADSKELSHIRLQKRTGGERIDSLIHELAQQPGCSEPRDCGADACRISLARGH